MKYYEITKESPAYNECEKVWKVHSVWQSAEKDLKELLGCEVMGNIGMNPGRLALNNVPDNLKNQFCKPDRGYCFAKVNSKTNVAFIEISKKHGLYRSTAFHVALILGTAWHRGNESYHPPMNGKYYIETERKIENLDGLVEISESDFLRLRADWLDAGRLEIKEAKS